jgi:hypothetical protein
MDIFTTQQAAEYLELHPFTIKKYVADADIPLTGELLNPRMRVFTLQELEAFKQWLAEHPEHGKQGRPVGWRKHPQGEGRKAADRKTVPFRRQNIADYLKRIITRVGGNDAPELARIQAFERMLWDSEVMRKVAGDRWIVGDRFGWMGEELPTAADALRLIDVYETA